MINKKQFSGIRPVLRFIGAIVGSIVLAGLLVTPTFAGSPFLPPRPDPDLPPRPGNELPPRPEPPPAPTMPHLITRHKPGPAAGAYIMLSAPPGNTALWTVVQWQDRQGDWHPVQGWQGTFEAGEKKWWVAARDFNTGPFRWVIFAGPNGPALLYSDVFFLPQAAYQTVSVTTPAIP